MLEGLLAWLESTGPWTTPGFAVLFFALNVLGVPATFLASAAGFFLGTWIAIPLALLARSFAALTTWYCGRKLLGQRVRAALLQRPRLNALDRALGDGSFWAVIQLRLAPTIPSALTSFGLGLSRVRPGPLFVGTLIGTLPNTIIAVLIGASLEDLAELESARSDWSFWLRLLIILGLLALLLLVRSLLRRARQFEPESSKPERSAADKS